MLHFVGDVRFGCGFQMQPNAEAGSIEFQLSCDDFVFIPLFSSPRRGQGWLLI